MHNTSRQTHQWKIQTNSEALKGAAVYMVYAPKPEEEE